MPQAVSGHSIRHYPRALPKSAREKIEAAVEAHLEAISALTACLDTSDGDADREPSIGAQEPGVTTVDQERWAHGNDDDREGDEHDGCEPDVDDEHSLGWPVDMNQERTFKNCSGTLFLPGTGKTIWISLADGLEADHDGREPNDEAGEHDFGKGAL